MQQSWIAVLTALPLLVGASLPPNRPIPPTTQKSDVVEIDFFDRLLRDNSGRRHSGTAHRRTRTAQGSKATPPAPAIIPVPIPRPTDGTETPTAPEQPEAAPALPVRAAAPQDQPPSTPVEPPANAAPVEKPADVPASPAQAETPTVRQPATATEPAHDAEVPKPLAKPTEQPPKEAPGEPAAKPDATQPEPPAGAAPPPSGEEPKPEEKPAEPPPPPIATEDPEELKACLADLAVLGTRFKPIDRIDDGEGCGIDKPIEVAEVLPGIELGRAVMRCKTAQALGHWLKDTVQPAMSVAMPGRRITGIVPGSTYACRLRNSAATGKISEHARGNGFDVAAFEFDNGEKMEMTPRGNDHTMEGAFQRTVTAGACMHFTTVLAPGSDASHETHMHLDVIDRNGGYRICE